jgi:hypothetical protein
MKRNTKLLEELISHPNEVIQKVKDLSADEIGQLSEELLRTLAPEFLKMLREDKDFQAKLIASYVRNNIEDFHFKYLNDDQMKELNPLIRNAIYSALINFEDALMDVYLHSICYVPKYWEDCEYCASI